MTFFLGGYIHGNKKWFRQIGSWNFSPTAPPPDGNYLFFMIIIKRY